MIKIMADTNVFLYYFFKIDESKLPLINNLLKESLHKKVQLMITTRILDELIFKSIILSSGLDTKKLKSDKKKMKRYGYVIENIFNFIKDFNIEIKETKQSHYEKLKNCVEKYGLFPNNCLTLIAMNSLNLKYIATFDGDFDDTFAVNWFCNK